MNAPAYAFALELTALAENSDVLEIGFGTGRMIELMLSRTRGRIVGVDPTPTMVEVAAARRVIREAGDRVQLYERSDRDLDFPPESFNRVLAIHAFQFWAEPEATLRIIHGLMRPGGRLVLVLRRHDRAPPDWLPNPLSRSGREVEATERLVAAAGFRAEVVREGAMVGVLGDKSLSP